MTYPAPTKVASAWDRVLLDCGCRDIYYCPSGDDLECPRHGGFDTCCARTDEHIPVRPYLLPRPKFER